MSTRQLSYLVKRWITEAGLDPKRYSIESLRRTKALHILRGTGDLQTLRALLGHVQIESTARYLTPIGYERSRRSWSACTPTSS